MNKRQQLKLEDMEEEIDSLKKEFKTKKIGRPLGSKRKQKTNGKHIGMIKKSKYLPLKN